MKVLLDENLPHKLRSRLAGHEFLTVGYLGWSGLKNGELLKTAEESGIEVLLTADKSIQHQQNFSGRSIAIVTLSPHNWPIARECVATIQHAIDTATTGSYQSVTCGPAGVNSDI